MGEPEPPLLCPPEWRLLAFAALTLERSISAVQELELDVAFLIIFLPDFLKKGCLHFSHAPQEYCVFLPPHIVHGSMSD